MSGEATVPKKRRSTGDSDANSSSSTRRDRRSTRRQSTTTSKRLDTLLFTPLSVVVLPTPARASGSVADDDNLFSRVLRALVLLYRQHNGASRRRFGQVRFALGDSAGVGGGGQSSELEIAALFVVVQATPDFEALVEERFRRHVPVYAISVGVEIGKALEDAARRRESEAADVKRKCWRHAVVADSSVETLERALKPALKWLKKRSLASVARPSLNAISESEALSPIGLESEAEENVENMAEAPVVFKSSVGAPNMLVVARVATVISPRLEETARHVALQLFLDRLGRSWSLEQLEASVDGHYSMRKRRRFVRQVGSPTHRNMKNLVYGCT